MHEKKTPNPISRMWIAFAAGGFTLTLVCILLMSLYLEFRTTQSGWDVIMISFTSSALPATGLTFTIYGSAAVALGLKILNALNMNSKLSERSLLFWAYLLGFVFAGLPLLLFNLLFGTGMSNNIGPYAYSVAGVMLLTAFLFAACLFAVIAVPKTDPEQTT